MIKLIVGLGNPGRQYTKTRHNAGFLFLDVLADEYAVSWDNELKFQGLASSASIAGHKVFFLKPQTFMNRSGVSVGAFVRYYKLSAEEVLVVHDELDLSAGVVKLKKGGGHAGHNGLRDIIAHLGVKDFYRLRVGIGRPPPGKSVSDFVLSGFSKDDVRVVESCFDCVGREMDDIVLANMALVMNKLNAK